MRVQEHLFQGFFGLKTKKDSLKFYRECVEKLKYADLKLDECINEFQTIVNDHKKNLNQYDNFIKHPSKITLNILKKELETLEGITNKDKQTNAQEEKHILQIKSKIEEISKTEESPDLKDIEKEIITDLDELDKLLNNIEGLWAVQLAFVEKEDELILRDVINIKVLGDILKEESDILNMEEQLLRKIDLKLGNVLRKTTLKLRGIEEEKNSSTEYKEIKHIR